MLDKDVRRYLLPLSLVLLLAGGGSGASAQNKPEQLARLHRVTAASSLDLPGAKPWHLALTIQLNDTSGTSVEKGTVERWWAAPGQVKTVYAFPSFHSTEVRTPEGIFRTPGTGSAPYLVEYLTRHIMHPMPADSEIDESTLDVRKETFGKDQFDCFMLTRPIPGVAFAPFGLFPTYCLDHEKDLLRVVSESGAQLLVLNRIGAFRGMNIALDAQVSSAGKILATAHVDTLQGREQAYPETQAKDGLELVKDTTMLLSADTVAGAIVNKVQPVYPQAAKARHAAGTVILHAIIGTDGHVRSLNPMTFPDPDLVISAMAAVRQWTYKPYILNGLPVEVDTTIKVNYALSR